jgi:hypothetical protein
MPVVRSADHDRQVVAPCLQAPAGGPFDRAARRRADQPLVLVTVGVAPLQCQEVACQVRSWDRWASVRPLRKKRS